MKGFWKKLLVMIGIGALLMPAESDSDSGGSDSDSGSSDSGDSLTSSVSGSNSAEIFASVLSGDPMTRRVGISDELSGGSSEASSSGDDDEGSSTTKRRKRKAPQSTEGVSNEELGNIPYSDQYADFDTSDSSDSSSDSGGSDSSE